MRDPGPSAVKRGARPCSRRRLLASALLVLMPAALGAQSPPLETLTLATAAQRALAAHPSVQAAVAGQEAAGAGVGVARADWFPHLGLSASATRFEKPMLVHPIHGFTPADIPPFSRTTLTGTLGLDLTLYDGGERRGRVRAARAQESAAAAQAAGTAQDLIQRLVVTYVGALGRGQLLDAHERRLEALRAERARVQQVLDAGRAARVDLLRAEAELHRAEAERVERQAEWHLTLLELARLIGAPAIPPASLRPVSLTDAPLPGRDGSIHAALRSNAELQRARAALQTARAGASVARAQRWPQLGLFARGQAWSDAAGHDTAEWNAGVQLGYPLFTAGARRHRIAAADAEVRDAEARVRLLQLEIERRVDRARSDAQEAQARTASLRTAVARFQEVRRIRLLALDTGTGTQTQYLDAEADLLDAQARLIEARYREIASRSALAWHTGQLDLEWLRRNLENR